jgi:hypothetical protein
MTLQTKPLSDITHQAISLLTKELGVANTIRFISQFTTGYGNYTEEREDLFKDLSLNDIVSEIKAGRQ